MKTTILTLAFLTAASVAAQANPCTSLAPRCSAAPLTSNPAALAPECQSPAAYAAWVAREAACQAAAASMPAAVAAREAAMPHPTPPRLADPRQ